MSECLAVLMMMFPPQDFVCVEYLDYPVPIPPASNQARLFVRSYWPYDEQGERMVAWGGQCDHDCGVTATGWPVPYLASEYMAGPVRVAACPSAWTNKTVVIDGYGRYRCWDRFGNRWYDKGLFYHHVHGWGYAVDLLWPGVHDTAPVGSWRVE